MSRWVHYFHISEVTSLKSFYLGSQSLTSIIHFNLGKHLTGIDHVMLNMESGVIEPYTDKGLSTGQSRTKCYKTFQLESTSQYPMVATQLWNLDVHVKPLFMPRLGNVVIHLWKPDLCPLMHCDYPPHEIYGDLTSYDGKGHTLLFKFPRC